MEISEQKSSINHFRLLEPFFFLELVLRFLERFDFDNFARLDFFFLRFSSDDELEEDEESVELK